MWDNKLYRQVNGCPMGRESSCPVSRVVMDFWVKQIHKMAEKMDALATISPVQYDKLEIYLLEKYVDDVLTALEELKLGLKFDPINQILTWDPDLEQAQRRDKSKPEFLTMELLCKMASLYLVLLSE